jgi:hypothetical protein
MNFDGMWAEPGNDPREALEPGRGEKAVLEEYLDRYRTTLELKCEGLTGLTPDLGHAESSIVLGKRGDPVRSQEELHRRLPSAGR